MARSDQKPIVSTRSDDPDLEDRIDAFVFELGDRIDGLQELELGGRFQPLREEALRFAAESAELGYGPLAAAAERIATACDERNPESVHKSVVDLTELSKRARSGHRGAA